MILGELIKRLQKLDADIDLSELKGLLEIYRYKDTNAVQCIYFGDHRIYGGSSPFDDSIHMLSTSGANLNDVCEGLINVLRHV